jgi:hypothetical protein
MKQYLLEITFFGVVMFMSAAALARLTPVYRAPRISAFGNTELAMIRVPVPVQSEMEGKKTVYRISCALTDGVMDCAEAQ